MRPLIQTPEDSARLRELALAWCGTPWTADGAVKGTGVSCSMLPYAVLGEFGHDAPLPPARSNVLKRDIIPTMIRWMAEHPLHYREVPIWEITTGDIPMFNLGIGHMALSLGGTEILHAWQTANAHVSNFADTNLSCRLMMAWRPFKQ